MAGWERAAALSLDKETDGRFGGDGTAGLAGAFVASRAWTRPRTSSISKPRGHDEAPDHRHGA
ncbi:hypothetical protein ASD51_07265 [Streptomyces sp. Root55]|nr:hypothetical protein ASD26_17790 [Streptomyces sp. Root1319]KQZ10079.1 hypothetical protein ASD51_07265 [Streptomyces sp. Root55]